MHAGRSGGRIAAAVASFGGRAPDEPPSHGGTPLGVALIVFVTLLGALAVLGAIAVAELYRRVGRRDAEHVGAGSPHVLDAIDQLTIRVDALTERVEAMSRALPSRVHERGHADRSGSREPPLDPPGHG